MNTSNEDRAFSSSLPSSSEVDTTSDFNTLNFTEWTYVDVPNPNLVCSVCTFPFISPVTLGCSHTFCNACITECLKHRQQCPTCRDPCVQLPQRASLALRNLVDELLVYCPFPGCKVQGQRQWMSQQHLDLCSFNSVHPWESRRCLCSSQGRKLENLESYLRKVQEDQLQLSQRMMTLEAKLDTQVLPALSTFESHFLTIFRDVNFCRNIVSNVAQFKMETMQGCSVMQSDIYELQKSCKSLTEIVKRCLREIDLRIPKEKKL